MKKFIFLSVMFLAIGQTFFFEKSDLLIGGEDDLIEIYSDRYIEIEV